MARRLATARRRRVRLTALRLQSPSIVLRVALIILLSVHGLIHLFGFAKAFGLAEPAGLTLPISRPWGAVWLLCALLFIAAAALRALGVSGWWIAAVIGVIASQVAIAAFWSDAKFGTLANVIILLVAVVGFGQWRFQRMIDRDVAALTDLADEPGAIVHDRELDRLPLPVQRWLRHAGVVGRARPRLVTLRQRGEMQTAPGGSWMRFGAEQWIATRPPGFVWSVDVDASGMFLRGRDRYHAGNGAMRIEALALVPVADASGPKIDQASLLRYLGEMVWYPAAALEPYVAWEELDESSARATMTFGDVTASGVFRFDDVGRPKTFEARRYRDDVLEDWLIEADEAGYRSLGDMRLPLRWTVSWRRSDGDWTWLRLDVDRVDYDGVALGQSASARDSSATRSASNVAEAI